MITISDDIIQPFCLVQLSGFNFDKMMPIVKKYDGTDFKKILGMYVESFDNYRFLEEPILNAVKGERIIIKENEKWKDSLTNFIIIVTNANEIIWWCIVKVYAVNVGGWIIRNETKFTWVNK